MTYVLIAIVIFHSASGITSDTIREEFATQALCESARETLLADIQNLKGTLGREVLAQCAKKL